MKKFNKPTRPAVPSFGVGTKRFTKSIQENNNLQVGPGTYNPNIDGKKIKNKFKNLPPPKDAARFP